jgi:cysteinyl-tRNA synthetase
MEEVVRYVLTIVEHGLAYESNGNVYFDTAAFKEANHRYGKLCPWVVATMELAAENEANSTTSEKKNPNDFPLWKVRTAQPPVIIAAPAGAICYKRYVSNK